MRYVFIAGLEHSGTTLTDDLLSQRLGGVGLGEVAGFLSPEHMRQYLARWGAFPDARTCSCGSTWDDCPFWSELRPIWGLSGDRPVEERYRNLLARVRARYGVDAVVVDSSKVSVALDLLLDRRAEIGLDRGDLRVILAVKDARSFVASVVRKSGSKKSVLAVIRAFRWWRAANRGFISALEGGSVPFAVSLYESLCASPDEHCERLARQLDLELAEPRLAARAEAHIAIGNKDYLNYSRGRIRYDSRWFHDDRIQLAYLLLPAVRRFNRELHARCAAAETTLPR